MAIILKMARIWVMVSIGLLVVLLGLVTFWLPLPVGLPLIVLGTLILVRNSLIARRLFTLARRRSPLFRRIFRHLPIPRRPRCRADQKGLRRTTTPKEPARETR